MEVWKDIEHYEGLYQVSNLGRVRNERKQILSPFKTQKGYLVATLYKNGVNIKRYVHRLVALNFINNDEYKPQVNHLDHDKTNNKETNLEWSTAQENMEHMLAARRSKQQCYTVLMCIKTQEELSFYSNAEASRYLGRYKDYVSNKLRLGIFLVSDHDEKQYKIII